MHSDTVKVTGTEYVCPVGAWHRGLALPFIVCHDEDPGKVFFRMRCQKINTP
jgi:hypothetical protein